jgi:predicted transcriptional regulator
MEITQEIIDSFTAANVATTTEQAKLDIAAAEAERAEQEAQTFEQKAQELTREIVEKVVKRVYEAAISGQNSVSFLGLDQNVLADLHAGIVKPNDLLNVVIRRVRNWLTNRGFTVSIELQEERFYIQITW